MLEFEELRLKLTGYESELLDLADALGLKKLQSDVEQLEAKSAEPDFWNDVENSHKILQRISQAKSKIAAYDALKGKYDDALTLIELADEEGDTSLIDEVTQNVADVIQEIGDMRLTTLLSGEYDANNAVLTFHAGAGGTEAQDWVQMLYRMYLHYAERKGFKAKTIDFLDGEEAGLKSATVVVEGFNAYGYLKSEAGVHRLVRV
ncbi:MAG: PCRF domain-containing protein, partial [Clostridia bacterium]|nr:PCRF domain-containing protein [Clostridia bacterium]